MRIPFNRILILFYTLITINLFFINKAQCSENITFSPQPNSPYKGEAFDIENLRSGIGKAFVASRVGKLITSGDPNKIPGTLRDIINYSLDIPMSMIEVLHNQSENYWSAYQLHDEIMTTEAYAKTRTEDNNLDLRGIKELNLRAVKIWKQLKICNDNNLDKVRLKFYYAKSNELCDKDESLSMDYFRELRQLGINYKQYLENSMPLVNLANFPLQHDIFKNLHPFLVEYAISIWGQYFNHVYEKPFSRNTKGFLDSAFTNFDKLIRHTNLVNNARDYIPNNIDKNYLIEYIVNEQMTATEVQIVKLISNSLLFLSRLEYDNIYSINKCAIYGLWPALNASILSQASGIMQYTVTPMDPARRKLQERVNNNCDNFFSLGSGDQLVGVYALYLNSNILNLRYRFQTFISEDSNIDNLVEHSENTSFLNFFKFF